jgi:nitrogen-specific signal transduction histidine kinase
MILIREELHKGFITVIIEDNGTGIPEEMKGKIFSPILRQKHPARAWDWPCVWVL